MKKQYMVPSVTMVEVDNQDVIVTSYKSLGMGGDNNSSDDDPVTVNAPRRNAIWDE